MENIECSICLSNENRDDNIIETKCNHRFHKNCIHTWINTHNHNYQTCPICRGNISDLGEYLNTDDYDKKLEYFPDASFI
jgi:hypothetical protein